MHKAFPLMLTAVFAGPAMAEPPAVGLALAACVWDSSAQRLSESGPTGGTRQSVNPYLVGNDFLSWEATGPSGTMAGGQIVLQHCPTNNYLLVVLPGVESAATEARSLFDSLIYSSGDYTLRQIAETVAPLGAGARVGQENIGRCGCETYGYGQ